MKLLATRACPPTPAALVIMPTPPWPLLPPRPLLELPKRLLPLPLVLLVVRLPNMPDELLLDDWAATFP
jgi:hypothetical protein